MVSEWNPRKEVPHSSNFQGDIISRETLFAARLKAVRLKAARRKAARLKAALVFPDKGKAVSRGVRKHEHPTDRGARDGCGVLNIGTIMCMSLGMCVLV